jgi:endoglucanase
MRHPAVPYHERAVRSEVEKICAEEKLTCVRDRFGNLIVRLQADSKLRPIALAAHLDHPGFKIVGSASRQRLTGRFLGGVPDSYFRHGTSLRLLPDGSAATLGRRLSKTEKLFEIVPAKHTDPKPEFAVWELPNFKVTRGLIHARACDDLIGVGAILATLIELKRSRAKVNVIGVISRAEEVGFHGALTVAASRVLPRNALVISLETSRELPGVKMGNGVILRVGDRACVFDSAATRFLAEVGADLKKRRKPFQFQRALMSGGTCEATAYQEYGFQTAAVCVALGNYHNCGEQNRIKAEYVSLADAMSMIDLLAASARQMRNYPKLIAKLAKRLNGLLQEAKNKLAENP